MARFFGKVINIIARKGNNVKQMGLSAGREHSQKKRGGGERR
jgi:hypothetical protein